MQRKTPRFHDAQRGPRIRKHKDNYQSGSIFYTTREWRSRFSADGRWSIERHSVPFAPQSAQYLFSSSFNNSDKIVWLVFCLCPLSFCVREDIIEGNEHQQPLYNFDQTKMAKRKALRKPVLSPRAQKPWRGPYVITFCDVSVTSWYVNRKAETKYSM